MTNAFGSGEKVITTILLLIFLTVFIASFILLMSSIYQRRRFKTESLPSLEDIMGAGATKESDELSKNVKDSKESSLFDIDEIGDRERAIDPMFSGISETTRAQHREANRKKFLRKK